MSAAALRGMAIAEDQGCSSCHTANYSGGGFYPNITPHTTTGIGDWSDEEIAAAISDGEGPDGDELCALMQRYELNVTELADLVAFLKSLTPVNKRITGMCPGS